jgi:hypothetical protein
LSAIFIHYTRIKICRETFRPKWSFIKWTPGRPASSSGSASRRRTRGPSGCAPWPQEAAGGPGTDVIIYKIFSPKKLSENIGLFAQTNASFNKNFCFGEKRQFFAEIWQKSQKIVIITSTPGVNVIDLLIEAG